MMQQWQELADYILPVLLGEYLETQSHDHYWIATGNHALMSSDFPPGKWRDTYLALSKLVLTGSPVTVTTMQDATIDSVDRNSLGLWFAAYLTNGKSTLKGKVFDTHLEQMKQIASKVFVKEVLDSVSRTIMDKNVDVEREIDSLFNRLILTAPSKLEHETAFDMADDFEQFINSKPDKHFMSGVQQLDMWTSGFAQSEFIAIIAAMKQRKTSLLLNVLLHMARKQGLSVGLLMFESNKSMITAQIIAMLAMEYVVKNNWYDDNLVGNDGCPIKDITAKQLIRIRAGYLKWGQERRDAIDYALAEFKALKNKFRIYDRTATGGNLSDCNSIHRVTMRDKQLYGTDILAIDHAQRVDTGSSSDYEILNIVAKEVEKLTRRENLTTFLLAQVSVAQADGNTNKIASGVRGGSALDEAVDHMIATSYRAKRNDSDQRYPADVLGLRLHHSRFADAGSHKNGMIGIDPNTGLILNKGIGLSQEEIEA